MNEKPGLEPGFFFRRTAGSLMGCAFPSGLGRAPFGAFHQRNDKRAETFRKQAAHLPPCVLWMTAGNPGILGYLKGLYLTVMVL
jgi:hypothetical protein